MDPRLNLKEIYRADAGARGVEVPVVDSGGFGLSAALETYGIDLTGATDAVPGLESLVEDAVAAGVPVILPAGRYLLDQMWEITDRVHVVTAGPDTVFVCNANTGSLAIRIAGEELDYLSGIRFGGFTIERSDLGTSGNGNAIRVQYVEDSAFGDVFGLYKGGGIFSLRDLRRCQFGDVIGAQMGDLGSGVFINRIEDCQFGRIIVDGAAEGIDFHDSDHCQVESVLARVTDEAVDMGNSRHIQVGKIIALECQALNCKVESTAGPGDGGSWGNQFGEIICLDAPAGATAVNFGNGPPENLGQRQDSNQVGKLIVWSENAGVVGLNLGGGLSQPISEYFRVGWVDIRVDGVGINARHQDGMTIGGGYVESASEHAVLIRDSKRVKVLGRLNCRGVGGSSSTSGVVQVSNIEDYELNVHVLESSLRAGIFIGGNHERGKVDAIIEETETTGLYLVAATAKNIQTQIKVRLKNIDIGENGDAAVRLQNTSGGTVEGLSLEAHFEDDQGTPTTRGLRVQGTWDHCTIKDGDYRACISPEIDGQSNIGANCIVRDNRGFITEASGTVSPSSGSATSRTVTHGCRLTPKAHQIAVTPLDWGSGTATKWWVSDITGSDFRINWDNAPGQDSEWAWRVVRSKVGA